MSAPFPGAGSGKSLDTFARRPADSVYLGPRRRLSTMSRPVTLPTPVLETCPIRGLAESLSCHRGEFLARFGGRARAVQTYFSPGRVNMFGGHLDYNGGPVLPTAIDRGTFIALRVGERGARAGRLRMDSIFGEEGFEGDLSSLPTAPSGKWFDYPLGVVRSVQAARAEALDRDVELLFGGNLPVGAGLSSSASITVGTAFALDRALGLDLDPLERVAAALDAERGFVGVQCGIMDPYAVGFAAERCVLWLDCKDESFEHLPLDFQKLSIGVVDSSVKRALARGEFNRRVAECRAAFESLGPHVEGATVLRDVPPEVVEAHAHELDADVAKRARHVVGEVARTFRAREAFLAEDFETLGALMTETHRSFQSLYECSCEELDVLVEAAIAQEGVFGARLTGAGFGGCIVMLVAAGAEETASRGVADAFQKRYGVRPATAFFQGDAGPRQVNP